MKVTSERINHRAEKSETLVEYDWCLSVLQIVIYYTMFTKKKAVPVIFLTTGLFVGLVIVYFCLPKGVDLHGQCTVIAVRKPQSTILICTTEVKRTSPVYTSFQSCFRFSI